jgi:hypothetical protein
MEEEEMIKPQREDGGSGFTRLFLTSKGKMNQYLSKAIKPPPRSLDPLHPRRPLRFDLRARVIATAIKVTRAQGLDVQATLLLTIISHVKSC